jgi:ferredoxin
MSLDILDKLFLGRDYVDSYYLRRRDNYLLIGMGCTTPDVTCFCTSIDCGPYSRKGSDLFISPLTGDRFILHTVTEKGEQFLKEFPVEGEEAGEKEAKERDEMERKAAALADGGVPVQDALECLGGMFDHPVWEELSEKCLNCGACTYLCPTCHCFDIQDEVLGNSGQRIRNWDSCMFPIFTLHGSGHQPRPEGYRRLRQRVMHKFNYYIDHFDIPACVGCGRCIRNCPVNLDIRRVISRIVEAPKTEKVSS